MDETRQEGVGLGLALLLMLVGLAVGMVSGLTIGATGGYLVGQRQADQTEPLAAAERAAMVPGATAVTPEMRREPGADAAPDEPGIVLGGADTPYLGVEVATQPVTDTEGAALPGASVLAVVPGTAAQEAGVQAGDRIVALDGEEVSSGADLAAAISRSEVGDEIALTVVRGDEELSMTATLGSRPGVIPLSPGGPNLEDLLEQMPPELQERFRRMLEPPSSDSDA